MTPLHPGSIVQITDESDPWYGAMLIVAEILTDGIRAVAPRPGTACLSSHRLTTGQFQHVGEAVVIRAPYDEEPE